MQCRAGGGVTGANGLAARKSADRGYPVRSDSASMSMLRLVDYI